MTCDPKSAYFFGEAFFFLVFFVFLAALGLLAFFAAFFGMMRYGPSELGSMKLPKSRHPRHLDSRAQWTSGPQGANVFCRKLALCVKSGH